MATKVGNQRLNAACARALPYQSPRYRAVINILENNQDRLPMPESLPEVPKPSHTNIRGPEYYQPTFPEEEENRDASPTNN